MRNNSFPLTGKRLAPMLALCLLPLLAACDRDSADSVAFGVSVRTADALYAGQPVTFQLDGNPDYIVFYSGEKNNRYANHDRTSLPEVDSLGLAYAAKIQYAENYDYVGKRMLRFLVSETYDGSRTPESIRPEEWHDITDPDPAVNAEPLKSLVLTGTGTVTELGNTAVNLSQYKDKDFYLAIRYLADPHTGLNANGDLRPDNNRLYSYNNRPRIDVTELKLVKREPDKNLIEVEDMVHEFAFTPVFVHSKVTNNFTLSSYRMMFQPQEYVTSGDAITVNESQDYELDVWMVSQKISAHGTDPDRGTAIKGTNARLATYQHTYSEPGTYTATFVVKNANKWNAKESIYEVTVEVKE